MKKYWGSCLLGILFCLILITSMSDAFWFELRRGFIHTLPVLLVYFVAVVGAVIVLGVALWGYNILVDDRQPLIHHIWISSMVLILVCIIVWFIEKVFSIL